MSELDDHDLLTRYARENSEAAFAALAERHVNLVYSVALRSVGNPHAAEEIAQAVFIILANKAEKLSRRVVLSGWLYQTTRLTAANFLRTEIRRQKREQEAYMQSTLNEPEAEAWRQIAPLLDDALAKLGERDRNAIVLRFFENKSLRDVGAAIGASEDAAKMRVNRALEKLRKFFTKRGVALSAMIIGGAVSANSVRAAPVGLAATISATAVKSSAVAASTLTLVKGALKIMAWTKVKTAIVVGIVIILATGTTTTVIQYHRSHFLDESFWRLDYQTLIKAPPVVALRPSRNKRQSGTVSTDTRMLARSVSLGSLLYYAYAPNNIYYQFHHEYRAVLTPDVDDREFDLLLTLTDHPQEALQAKIKKQLGLVAHFEPREADVILLKPSNTTATRLMPSSGNGSTHSSRGRFDFTNQPIFALTDFVESHFGKLVIDETGLTEHYSGSLKWNPQSDKTAEQNEIQNAFSNQLGLELVPSHETVEMLVIEKTN